MKIITVHFVVDDDVDHVQFVNSIGGGMEEILAARTVFPLGHFCFVDGPEAEEAVRLLDTAGTRR